GVRRDAQSLLRAARHRGAAGADRPGVHAHRGAAPGRLQQPGRRRDQEKEGRERHSARRHSVSPVLHGQGPGRGHRVPDGGRGDRILHARDVRLVPRARQLHAGQHFADAHAHQAALVFHAVLLDPARHHRADGALYPDAAGDLHGRTHVRQRARPAGAHRHGRGGGGAAPRLLAVRCQGRGRGADGAVARAAVPAALARARAGQVRALPGLDVQDRAGPVRGRVRHARLARDPAGFGHQGGAGPARHGGLFPVLPADALVHHVRSNQTGAGEGHVEARLIALAALLWLLAVPSAWAVEAGHECGEVECDPVRIDLGDRPSLQRGARIFVNYCLSCHSASYMRYERMGRDLGISEELVRENLLFAAEQVGDLMQAVMSTEDATDWFGTAPPDLSLVTRYRDPEWVYTFLRGFYRDDDSPSGWNNVVFPNVAMTHVLFEWQGEQRP